MRMLNKINKRLKTFGKFNALAWLILLTIHCHGQKIATLEVTLNGAPLGLDIPVHVNLDAITHAQGTALSLVEIQGKKRVPVIFQLEEGA